MKKSLYLIVGILIGATVFGGASAHAAGILAERSSHHIFVDGKEVQLEAYGITGHNYVKLRDIGKVVGFNVFWDVDSGCVQIETGVPYTGEAPTESETDTPASQPEVTTPIDADTMKQDIVDCTNALRKENGIAALTADDKLMQAGTGASRGNGRQRRIFPHPARRSQICYRHRLSICGRKYSLLGGVGPERKDACRKPSCGHGPHLRDISKT